MRISKNPSFVLCDTVVNVSMFSRETLFFTCFALAFALGNVGCVGNKNKDVAEAPVAAPPPAAYPDSSSSSASNDSPYGQSSAPTESEIAATAATNRSSAPPAAVQFSLRNGEQLMPYKIQPGDNLGKIASKYNTSVSRIMAANSMTNDKIYAGKTLQVPTSAPPTGMALNGTGASAPSTPSSPYPSSTASSPYPSTTAPAPAPRSPTPSYGNPSYGSVAQRSPYSPPVSSSSSVGSYGGASSAPAYSAPAPSSSPYPSTTAPPTSPAPPAVTAPSNPASTSYPRTQAPQPPAQPGGAFPTPSLGGGGQIQFSN